MALAVAADQADTRVGYSGAQWHQPLHLPREYTAAIVVLASFMGCLIEEKHVLLRNFGRPQRDGLGRAPLGNAAFERDQARLQTLILGIANLVFFLN